MLNELREIKSDMALLKNLSAEVSQIRESIQLPQTAVKQGLSSPGFRNYASATLNAHFLGIGPITIQDREGEQLNSSKDLHHIVFPSRQEFNEGDASTVSRAILKLLHPCYRCGSSEHFFAGCRAKAVNSSRDAYLNERGLLPRDME